MKCLQFHLRKSFIVNIYVPFVKACWFFLIMMLLPTDHSSRIRLIPCFFLYILSPYECFNCSHRIFHLRINCSFYLVCSHHCLFFFSSLNSCNSCWRTCTCSSTCLPCSSKALTLLFSTIFGYLRTKNATFIFSWKVALIPYYQELLLTIQEVGIKIEESRKEERIPAMLVHWAREEGRLVFYVPGG